MMGMKRMTAGMVGTKKMTVIKRMDKMVGVMRAGRTAMKMQMTGTMGVEMKMSARKSITAAIIRTVPKRMRKMIKG